MLHKEKQGQDQTYLSAYWPLSAVQSLCVRSIFNFYKENRRKTELKDLD
jgi:hypothetical protein